MSPAGSLNMPFDATIFSRAYFYVYTLKLLLDLDLDLERDRVLLREAIARTVAIEIIQL